MSNPIAPKDPVTTGYAADHGGDHPSGANIAPGFSPQPSNAFRPLTIGQKILGIRVLWPALALVLLLLYNLAFTPGFFSVKAVDGRLFGSLIDVLGNGTVVATLAIGMTLVIATGGVDLSVGSVMAISGAIAAVLIVPPSTQEAVAGGHGWNFWPAVFVALGVSALVGAFNGLLVAVLRIQPIIATLIVMVAGRGVAQMIANGVKYNFDDAKFVAIGNDYFFYFPLGVTIVLIVAALCAVSTRLTGLGLAIECVGDSPSASRYVGLRVRLITIAAYVVSALCAAVAGLIEASKIRTADPINSGDKMELYAIFAVVVGGTALAGGRFTLVGSLLGALLFQTLQTTLLSTKVFDHDIKSSYLPLPIAVVIIVVSLLQSARFREAMLKPFASLRRAA